MRRKVQILGDPIEFHIEKTWMHFFSLSLNGSFALDRRKNILDLYKYSA